MKGIKKILLAIVVGIVLGLASGYLTCYSPDTFLSLPDVAIFYGFWILLVCITAYTVNNLKDALLLPLMGMAAMHLSYYAFMYFVKRVPGSMHTMFWALFLIFAAGYSGLLFRERTAKKAMKIGFIITALPLSVLYMEAVYLVKQFVLGGTHFPQMLFDVLSAVVLTAIFITKRDYRYIRKLIISAAVLAVPYGTLMLLTDTPWIAVGL